MIQLFSKFFSKILLSPFALVYGIVVSLRGFLYRSNLMRSSRFDIPTICVGNLSVGGSGKTPHIEYLIRMLQPYINVSVLSRGYKRKTEGFRMVQLDNDVTEVGDEPLQFKRKYPSVPVAVGEKRAYAIPQMLYQNPNIQCILLDDAFQHLAVRPYLNILLTEFNEPFTRDYLLPAGRLRDWRHSYRRADIIIITKCPFHLDDNEKQRFINEINPYPHQRIYFSFYDYGTPYSILNTASPIAVSNISSPSSPVDEYAASTPQLVDLDMDTTVLLVCAIAKADYLVEYLSSKVKSVQTMEFEDHRVFSNYDVAQFKRLFDDMPAHKKIIITTEKDATRLELHKDYIIENQMIMYAIPIEVNFHFNEKETFNNDIKKMLLDFKI